MGQKTLQKPIPNPHRFTPTDWQEDSEFNDNSILDFGHYTTLKNKKTGQIVDKFYLTFLSAQDLDFYTQSYKWRTTEELICRAYYMQPIQTHNFCAAFFAAEVYIQHPKSRLSDFKDIPFPDNLYCLKAVLEGYRKLYCETGSFPVSEEQVCINEEGKISVWLNSDLSKNYPEEFPIEPQDMTEEKQEQDMVLRITNLIFLNTDESCEPTPSLAQYFQQLVNQKKEQLTFETAISSIEKYARIHNQTVPEYFTSVVDIYENQDEFYGFNDEQERDSDQMASQDNKKSDRVVLGSSNDLNQSLKKDQIPYPNQYSHQPKNEKYKSEQSQSISNAEKLAPASNPAKTNKSSYHPTQTPVDSKLMASQYSYYQGLAQNQHFGGVKPYQPYTYQISPEPQSQPIIQPNGQSEKAGNSSLNPETVRTRIENEPNPIERKMTQIRKDGSYPSNFFPGKSLELELRLSQKLGNCQEQMNDRSFQQSSGQSYLLGSFPLNQSPLYYQPRPSQGQSSVTFQSKPLFHKIITPELPLHVNNCNNQANIIQTQIPPSFRAEDNLLQSAGFFESSQSYSLSGYNKIQNLYNRPSNEMPELFQAQKTTKKDEQKYTNSKVRSVNEQSKQGNSGYIQLHSYCNVDSQIDLDPEIAADMLKYI